MYTSKDDYLINTLRFVFAKEATHICGAILLESLTSPKMKKTKAYKTYLGFASGATPPKKAQKFKKFTSPQLSTGSVSSEEPTKKSKRVKRSTKKSTKALAGGVVIRETLKMPLSKKKEKMYVARDVPEVYMHQFWDSVYKHDTFYIFKMNKRKRFKLTLEIFKDIMKICPRVQGRDFDAFLTDEEIMSFLRELGHTREINSLNDIVVDHMVQPWRTFVALTNKSLFGKTTGLDKLRLSRGNDKDDRNNEQDSGSEGSDEENDNDDKNTQPDSEKGSNSEHETVENESDSESDQEENKEEIGDDEE
nr:hypothetical protein [Tanacetum cinerariifolium]